MKENFISFKKTIEELNIHNNHEYRELVNCLDYLQQHIGNKSNPLYYQYKEEFTKEFLALGLYVEHAELLDILDSL